MIKKYSKEKLSIFPPDLNGKIIHIQIKLETEINTLPQRTCGTPYRWKWSKRYISSIYVPLLVQHTIIKAPKFEQNIFLLNKTMTESEINMVLLSLSPL